MTSVTMQTRLRGSRRFAGVLYGRPMKISKIRANELVSVFSCRSDNESDPSSIVRFLWTKHGSQRSVAAAGGSARASSWVALQASGIPEGPRNDCDTLD
jgi:hypothetical protein